MTKISGNICDFNPNLPNHLAHFRVAVTANGEVTAAERLNDKDICADHILDIVRIDLQSGDAHSVTITRLPDSDLPEVVASLKKRSRSSDGTGEHQCPECEKWYSSPSSLISHRRKQHNYQPEGENNKCPVPGCDFASTTVQGVSMHLRRTHPAFANKAKASRAKR